MVNSAMPPQTTNILQFICPTGFYGAERWIIALAKHMNREAMRNDLAVTVEPGMKKLALVEGFQELNLKTFELSMSNPFDIRVISQLCTLIRERKIDIIHTHGYKSDILGLIAAKITGIKCVATPHGFENADDWKLKTYIKLGCWSFRFFHHLAPLSTQLYDDVINAGVKPEKVSYIQNGVDLSEVEAIRDSDQYRGSSAEEKTVGFIGQMISRKNIGELLDVFDQLAKKHQNLRLVLLGDGEERDSLERYANTLASTSRIDFLGFRDDRLQLLKTFDLFVMTSTLEGIPRCLMETMGMGIPVAAYDIPGIDQLIKHEDTGLLAPLHDKETLAKCWESLLFDEQKAQEISENAKAFVYKHYSAQRMAAEYEALFKKLEGLA